MVSPSFLIALVCGAVICSAQRQQSQPECANEIHDFHQCMFSNAPPPPKTDFESIKKDADQCFAKTGCSPPGRRFHNQNGPGGRAGPTSTDNADFKCFNVHEKLFETFSNCMKQKDPEFEKGGPGGFGPPPGGPGGFGPPPGGPGGFGPPPGGPHGARHGPPSADELADSCGGDKDKAGQLVTCLQDVFAKHKPSKEEAKTHFDALCKADSTCKPKLGKCEEILNKKAQAACECHEQSRSKADEIFKQEPSCAKVQKPPFPEPANEEKPDCSKPPQSPCEEGFDKFYERMSSFPPPPPASQ